MREAGLEGAARWLAMTLRLGQGQEKHCVDRLFDGSAVLA